MTKFLNNVVKKIRVQIKKFQLLKVKKLPHKYYASFYQKVMSDLSFFHECEIGPSRTCRHAKTKQHTKI